ncbi:MAG: CPBP family intramembrane glutamic endopeptidase [Verrucomicrobiota bacterium]
MPESPTPPPLPAGSVAVAAPETKPYGFWATTGIGVAVLLSFITVQSVVMIIMVFALFGEDGMSNIMDNLETLALDGRILSLSMAVSFPVLIVGCAFFAFLRKGIPVRDYLALRPMSLGWWIALPPLTVAFVYALGMLLQLAGAPEENEWMLLVGKASVGNPLVWIGIVILAPVAEEILFRGFLHQGYAKTPIRLWGTIVLTSIGWSVIHAQYYIYGLVFIFVLGVALGVVRWKSNSIYGPILVHAVNNGFAMWMVMKAVQESAGG